MTSFSQAAERHLDDVYRYLVWFTGDRAAAEDLTGETFERALRLWPRFDPQRGSARTWLCQVARTAALDHFRSERRRTRREQLAASPERIDERFVEGLSPDLEGCTASALSRRARGRRASRRARSRRPDHGADARHLAHQLHDSPEPRSQEARGGTPCRSVTSSRRSAPQRSKLPSELRERVRLIAAAAPPERRSLFTAAASARRARPGRRRGRRRSRHDQADAPPGRSRPAVHAPTWRPDRHDRPRAADEGRRVPRALRPARERRPSPRRRRGPEVLRLADAARAERDRRLERDQARRRDRHRPRRLRRLGARRRRRAPHASSELVLKVPKTNVRTGDRTPVGARHDHGRAGRHPGSPGRHRDDRPHDAAPAAAADEPARRAGRRPRSRARSPRSPPASSACSAPRPPRSARPATPPSQLHLATPAPVPPKHHGHGPLHGLDVAFRWIGIGAVYGLALGVPALVLLGLGWLGVRTIRRRRENALLSRP